MSSVDTPDSTRSGEWSGIASDRSQSLQRVLNEYFIGVFCLRLKDVDQMVLVRPLNPKGLVRIEDSVRQKGWLDYYAPSIIVSRKELEDLQGGNLSNNIDAELLAKAHPRVLDGNHRVSVLHKLYGGEHRVKCTVYYEFDKEQMQIVADSFNEVTESVSNRGTYDKLYLYNERIKIIQEKTGRANVSTRQLAASYKWCKASAPSEVNLRQWKKAVYGLSEEALTAIRDLTYANDSTVDVDTISLAVLVKKPILDLKSKPLEQALVMHLIARYKNVKKSPFKHTDIAGLVSQAVKCADLRRAVESVIPTRLWSEKLESEVNKMTMGYTSSADFDLWVTPHLEDVKNELEELKKRIPETKTLPQTTVDIIKQKLPPRLQKVVEKDPNLRDHLISWRTKYRMAHNDVTRRQIALSMSRRGQSNHSNDANSSNDGDKDNVEDTDEIGDSNKDSDDDTGEEKAIDGLEEKGNHKENDKGKNEDEDAEENWDDSCPKPGGREGQPYQKYKPSPAGSMKHQAFCDLVEHVAEGSKETPTSEHICVRCKGSPPATRKEASANKSGNADNNATSTRKRKRKKVDDSTLPTPKPKLTGNIRSNMEESRARNTTVNQGDPLQRVSEAIDDVFDGDKLRVATPPKLAIVCVETAKTGLVPPPMPPDQTTPKSARVAVERFIKAIVKSLHPLGTVAIAVPRPWFTHGQHIRDLLSANTIVVEDSPLLIRYTTAVGGTRPQEAEAHQRNNVECILIGHKVPPPGETITINRRVTVEDVYGTSRGPLPMALQDMGGIANIRGEPTGGPKCVFPPIALQYLVNRFSRSGDAILGVGVESTLLAEVALEQSRRVEFYLTDSEYHQSLCKRIDQAFLSAFNAGLFQIDDGAQIYVGPNTLPAGLPSDTTPPRALQAMRAGDSVESARIRVAATAGFKLRYCESDGAYQLNLEKAPTGITAVHDIPIWGELVVYDTPQDAVASLSDSEIKDQLVRLIYLASNHQLRQMLEPGKELCHEQSALYMRVAKCSPLHCMPWETETEKADVDIVRFIPRTGTRSTMLEIVRGSGSGYVVAVARLTRRQKEHQKHPARRSLYVFSGDVVVGGPGFSSLSEREERK